MAANPNPDEVLVQIVLGTARELSKGQGRVGVVATEAAAKLRVSERTFRTLIAQGAIEPRAMLMGAAIYDADEIEALRVARSKV